MARVWTSALALVIVFLSTAGLAHAQNPVFAAEPKPGEGPDFLPNTEGYGPAATPFTTGLETFNAFDCPRDDRTFPYVYTGLGMLALSRGRPDERALVVLDPGITLPNLPTNVDTGTLPPGNAGVVGTTAAIPQDFQFGMQMTVGMQTKWRSYEVNGFYTFQNTRAHTITAPGMLDIPLFANSPLPLGFEGNNFLWLQADQVTFELKSELASGEFIVRRQWHHWFQSIIGLRYLYLEESLGVRTEDDSLVLPPPDPFRIATVTSTAENHIFGVQGGFDAQKYLVPILALGVNLKTMVGANFLQASNTLVRGDGFEGPSASDDAIRFGMLTEFNLYGLLWLNDNIRVQGGYHLLWLRRVADVVEQLPSDLTSPTVNTSSGSSVLYHGPRLELQITW